MNKKDRFSNPMIILSPTYLNVGLTMAQNCHAVAEYIKKYGDNSNGYIYVLGVDDLNTIKRYKKILDFRGINNYHFF